MMRLFLALCVALCLASPALAGGKIMGRLIYIAAPSPLPATQTIHFGVKTPVGFGGDPMAYAYPQNLAQTRWLGITSQKDASNNDVTIFQIDQRQMIVPKNGAGAYGSDWSSPGAGPYTVIVAEYTDAALTSPTGNSTTITVPIDLLIAHAREMTSAARGCNINVLVCAITNPDGSTGAFSAQIHQLSTLLTTGSDLCLGDTIKLRTGAFNPTSLNYRIRPPVGGVYCGETSDGSAEDRIFITSEVRDAALDANGNPRLQHGGKIGAVVMDAQTSGNVLFPYSWDYVWFYFDYPGTPVQLYFLSYASTTAGSGMNIRYSRVENGPDVADPNNTNGVQVHGVSTVEHSYFYNTRKGISGGGAGTTLTATWNICEHMVDDLISISGPNNVIRYNFCFNWYPAIGAHSDSFQHQGVLAAGTSFALGSIEYNISVRNVNPLDFHDAQGEFADDTVATSFLSSGTFRYNITSLTDQNQVYATRVNNLLVSQNTLLQALGSTNTSPDVSKVVVASGKGGTGATFTRNMANGYVTLNQLGTVTRLYNAAIPPVLANYNAVLPNFVSGTNPGIVTRAIAIAKFTPARGPKLVGDIHANTLIDNIVSTAGVVDGMPVNTQYVPLSDLNSAQQIYVVSHTATTLTLSQPLSATATGVTLGFGARNPDDTYNGALWPVNDFGETCWAEDGVAFDPTAHCTPAT